MSENPTRQTKQIAQLISMRHFEAYTWKICNVSSIPLEVDYAVQSPPFFFSGSLWALKMYPYGQTVSGSEGFIDVIVERLQFQTEKQRISSRIFCKDVSGYKVCTVNRDHDFESETRTPLKLLNFMQNFKDCTDKGRLLPVDTFTLVCALREYRKELPDKPLEQSTVKKFAKAMGRRQNEIGTISKEYLDFGDVGLKSCNLNPVPVGYEVQSQEFLFANATWILKAHPYFGMENLKKLSFDIVLERLQSKCPEHNVIAEINIDVPERLSCQATLFFIPSYTQSDAVNFQLDEKNASEAKCLHFTVELKMTKDTGRETESKQKLGENSVSEASVTPQRKILRDFKQLFCKKQGCDVVLRVKEQEFPAHRAILMARSPVFESTFRNDMKEKATGIVDIDDCDPSTFPDFLCFLYCEECNFSQENVYSLFAAADKYDVPDLREKCVEFIKKNFSVGTFCDAYTLALLHSETDPELIDFSTDFFIKNAKEIILTVELQSFEDKNPTESNELFKKFVASV